MKLFDKLKQKSPQQRFLFILGLFIFFFYLVLAYFVATWQNFPLDISLTRRYLMAGLLVLYAFFRFYRLLNKEE
jgi:hypothetical protein